ncbi:MAG: DedA family protein [Burkholderiaceae bacterium]|jgi:membrane protein DedA with SNARE-associated domain|nr:DedA family protein [Burkholderiaceae bacterium]
MQFLKSLSGFHPEWRTRLLVLLVVLATAASAILGLRTCRTYMLLSSAYEAGVPQTSSVRPWMTLGFVAATYRTPEAALWDGLGLPAQTDADTTLLALAERAGVSPANYLPQVQRAIATGTTEPPASVPADAGQASWLQAAGDKVVAAVLAYGYPALALSLLLGALGVPLPSGLSMIVAGSLAAQGQMRWEILVALATAASVAGDLTGYGVGRMLGSGFLDRRGHWFGLTAQRRARVDRLFERWGVLAVLLSRSLVSMLSSAMNYTAGAGRYRLGAFVAVGIAGRLLWSSAYLGLGYFASGGLEPANDFLRSLTGLLIALACLTGFAVALRRSKPLSTG